MRKEEILGNKGMSQPRLYGIEKEAGVGLKVRQYQDGERRRDKCQDGKMRRNTCQHAKERRDTCQHAKERGDTCQHAKERRNRCWGKGFAIHGGCAPPVYDREAELTNNNV